jgi:hypothetical protein
MGEHLETHMFLGSIKKGKKIEGFLRNNLFEPRGLFQRHEDLKNEMINRGYNHQSEILESDCDSILNLPYYQQYWKIDRDKALRDLLDRCPECHRRFMKYL